MPIELSKAIEDEAVTSIERYCREHLEEPIGRLAATGLLRFFVEEIGPLVYNRAVADVQQQLQARIVDLDLDVHEDAFQYWSRREKGGQAAAKRRR